MKKTKALLTLFVVMAISFWSCQSNQMPVENDIGSVNGTLYRSVQTATLYLYVDEIQGGTWPGTLDVNVQMVTTNWDEATVTWNTPWSSPGGVLGVDFGGIIASFDPDDDVDGWLAIDVTIAAQAWLSDPLNNYGLLLEHGSEPPYVIYRSREYPDDANPIIKIIQKNKKKNIFLFSL